MSRLRFHRGNHSAPALAVGGLTLALLLGGCGGSGSDGTDRSGDPSPIENPDVLPDLDGDGVEDDGDNCAESANPDQADIDADGVGDACDDPPDLDADAVVDNVDNCSKVANPDQNDGDADGFGDLCDNCPSAMNADQADIDGDGIGDLCPCDACAPGEWCSQHPSVDIGTECLATCIAERQGDDGTCCPLGSRWYEDAKACQLADVYVDADRVLGSAEIEYKNFPEGSCEIVEGCVLEAGRRRLLRFDTTTPNIGAGDLHLGRPEDVGDIFQYSECHQHYHFDTYASYELLDGQGTSVAPGHKQAFCLMDFEPWAPGIEWRDANYHCGMQGIGAGWADTYDSYLDCQFVDITDVPEGDYLLQVNVNYGHLLAESDYSNNSTEVPVHIPAP